MNIFNKIFLIFSVSCLTAHSQNINNIFPDFDKTGMKSSILYNPAGVSNIINLKNKKHSIGDFYQTYKSISFSDFEGRLSKLDEIKIMSENENLSDKVPLGLIFTEFDVFKENVQTEGLIVSQSNSTLRRIGDQVNIFDNHRLLVGAPLKYIQRGSNVNFLLSSETLINTTDLNIDEIQVDFGDGLGYRTISVEEPFNVSYSDEGKKEILFRVTLSDQSVFESSSELNVIYSNQELNTMNNQDIVGFTSGTTDPPYIQPYNEYPFKGWGEYDIFYSEDGILDKPIFLVDGFDPTDSRNINAVYAELDFDGGNLGDIVRQNGYDVVVLNFPTYFREEDQQWIYGGADYIERNSMLLVELIKFINNQKVGNEENVVIGASMGGLIARYGLNYMEANNIDHETRLYVSFDAPHAGANVPIGFQHMFNFLAYGLDTWVGDFSVESLRPLVDGVLKSPAARQMLWDHFEEHVQPGSAEFNNNDALPQPHPFFNIFYNAIDTVGPSEYPENSRNIAIINGSSPPERFFFNNGNPVNPGDQVLDAFLPNVSTLTDAYLDAWYTPNINVTSNVSNVYIDAPWICFCDITSNAVAQSHGHTAGVDTAPGGLFDINELTATYASSDPVVDVFVNQLLTNYFTFIPSVSAMDYFTNNWYEYMSIPERTPFDAWSMPTSNEPHVQLTPENVEFALNEIFQGNIPGQISADENKKSAIVFVENGNQDVASGRIYASSARGASRDGNGNATPVDGTNGQQIWGNIADWTVDFVVSERSPENAAITMGSFRDNQHPLYQGSDALTQNSTGMGALGWGSFGANVYNRASGVGSAVFGFNNIAGPSDSESLGITGDNIGQAVFGYGSRATGNVSFASGERNTASGSKSVAMGNFNYATGDSTIALGKENWAEGGSTIAIGYKNHAAGGGSVALGQENVAWGTTNFTSGYQNTAGNTNAAVGAGGSAVAMGKYNTASADASMALNRSTSAINQASTSMGLGTTADNVGMLAIGVNNAAGIGDTVGSNGEQPSYYFVDGQYTGSTPGVAFVIGNGDVNGSNGLAGNNPSNAFVVNYDGSATLSGDLTINSDMRLKSNIISLSGALAKLLEIDGKSYTMKSNDKDAKIGLLAQDVQKVLPELVKEADDKEGTLSVNYQGLIPVLINAIKEQQKQIDELKQLLNK